MSMLVSPFGGAGGGGVLKARNYDVGVISKNQTEYTYTTTFSKGGVVVVTNDNGYVFFPFNELSDSTDIRKPNLAQSMHIIQLKVDGYYFGLNAPIAFPFAEGVEYGANPYPTYINNRKYFFSVEKYVIPVAESITLQFTNFSADFNASNPSDIKSSAFYFTEYEYV